MKWKWMLPKLTAIAMMLATASSMPVLASNTTELTNHGSIGAVDIQLEYGLDGDVEAVLPNQEIPLKSAVTNLAEPAWVRMKIEYPVSEDEERFGHLAEENLTVLDDALITFAESGWEKHGDYYYLTEAMDMGASSDFTESIQLPDDWDNRMVQSQFGVTITAEAIQKSHFTPDFTAEDPWHGAVIEAYDATEYTHKEKGTNQFSIRYEGGAQGMVRTGDDFFANWETIMPGDVATEKADITNKMDIPVQMFFSMKSHADADTSTKGLLEQIHLKISHKDTVIYDGNLVDGKEEILLQEYKPGETGSLSYELSVPETIGNEFAQKTFESVWTLRALEIPPEPEKEVVKTGESLPFVMFVACSCAAIAGAGISLIQRKRRW